MRSAATVYIRSVDKRFQVTIDPPRRSAPSQSYETHREAADYAAGLREQHGWRVVDMSGWVPGAGILLAGRAKP